MYSRPIIDLLTGSARLGRCHCHAHFLVCEVQRIGGYVRGRATISRRFGRWVFIPTVRGLVTSRTLKNIGHLTAFFLVHKSDPLKAFKALHSHDVILAAAQKGEHEERAIRLGAMTFRDRSIHYADDDFLNDSELRAQGQKL